jgi:urease accessory protein
LLDAAAAPARDAALPRARGAARVEFAAARGATHLARLGQRSPVRVLLPRPSGADAVAVLLNTAGGVCGGDRIEAAAKLGPGARATVVGQAAERVYRALDRPAAIRTRLELGAGAALHWAPQETILFDGAMLERRSELHVEPEARLLAAETLVFGRRAMGERLRRLHLRDEWRLWRGARLVWADSLRLAGDGGVAALDAASGLRGEEALCTLVCAGAEPEAAREEARRQIGAAPLLGGASVVNGILVVRALGGAAAIRLWLTHLLAALRALALGFEAALPRVWSC